jgi:hypothetical protein
MAISPFLNPAEEGYTTEKEALKAKLRKIKPYKGLLAFAHILLSSVKQGVEKSHFKSAIGLE